MTSPLDNPIWHALSSAQSTFAESAGQAKRFPPTVTPLAAVEAADACAFRDLATLLRPRGGAALFVIGAPPQLDGLEVLQHDEAVQMICESPIEATNQPAIDVELLGPEDAPEMAALAERTQPGPFGARTIELGTYAGVRHGGRLVAMAGERLRLRGFTEISAVCTDPEHRGRGLAGALVTALASRIMARGEVPFLHVRSDNANAIRLYERLGFNTRTTVGVTVVRPQGGVA